MSISRFYTFTIQVRRMVWTADLASEEVIGSFRGHIQQARPDVAIGLGLAAPTTFLVWCDPNTDVQVQDKLVLSGRQYTVHFRQDNFVGSNQHIELTVERIDDYIGS